MVSVDLFITNQWLYNTLDTVTVWFTYARGLKVVAPKLCGLPSHGICCPCYGTLKLMAFGIVTEMHCKHEVYSTCHLLILSNSQTFSSNKNILIYPSWGNLLYDVREIKETDL